MLVNAQAIRGLKFRHQVDGRTFHPKMGHFWASMAFPTAGRGQCPVTWGSDVGGGGGQMQLPWGACPGEHHPPPQRWGGWSTVTFSLISTFHGRLKCQEGVGAAVVLGKTLNRTVLTHHIVVLL